MLYILLFPKDAFRDEDVERLYYQHEQLVENLLKRENRKIEEFNVEEVAEFIEKRIEEVKEEPFHKVKELLLELSGFLFVFPPSYIEISIFSKRYFLFF